MSKMGEINQIDRGLTLDKMQNDIEALSYSSNAISLGAKTEKQPRLTVTSDKAHDIGIHNEIIKEEDEFEHELASLQLLGDTSGSNNRGMTEFP